MLNKRTTWRYLMKMARTRPWLYLLHGLCWTVYGLTWYLTGLISQAFFDALTGQAHLPISLTLLLVLLLALTLGRVGIYLGGGAVEIALRFAMSGLLRRNLLRRVLEQPG